VFWLLGQLWARNCALTPRKLAAECSFAQVKNAFVGFQFGNVVWALEKFICVEFPARCTNTVIFTHTQNNLLAKKKLPIAFQPAPLKKNLAHKHFWGLKPSS
jgi:hypothetical protein